MSIQKTAGQLKVGDKILGNTNHFRIRKLTPSPLTGLHCPVIELEDSNGMVKTIDTGSSAKLQDHLYEVEEA